MSKDQNSGWLSRLKKGLSHTTAKLVDPLSAAFTRRRLDEKALEELEELLIAADLGPSLASKLTIQFSHTRFNKEVNDDDIRTALEEDIEKLLEPVAKTFTHDPETQGYVAPEIKHYIEPAGEVRFYLEFYKGR